VQSEISKLREELQKTESDIAELKEILDGNRIPGLKNSINKSTEEIKSKEDFAKKRFSQTTKHSNAAKSDTFAGGIVKNENAKNNLPNTKSVKSATSLRKSIF